MTSELWSAPCLTHDSCSVHVTPFPSSLLLVRLPWVPTLRNQKGREHRSTVFLPLLPAAPGRSIAGICWWDSVVRVLPSVWDLLVTCQLTDRDYAWGSSLGGVSSFGGGGEELRKKR